jgi:hypothetical protein
MRQMPEEELASSAKFHTDTMQLQQPCTSGLDEQAANIKYDSLGCAFCQPKHSKVLVNWWVCLRDCCSCGSVKSLSCMAVSGKLLIIPGIAQGSPAVLPVWSKPVKKT